jgi:hypothetical protein
MQSVLVATVRAPHAREFKHGWLGMLSVFLSRPRPQLQPHLCLSHLLTPPGKSEGAACNGRHRDGLCAAGVLWKSRL